MNKSVKLSMKQLLITLVLGASVMASAPAMAKVYECHTKQALHWARDHLKADAFSALGKHVVIRFDDQTDTVWVAQNPDAPFGPIHVSIDENTEGQLIVSSKNMATPPGGQPIFTGNTVLKIRSFGVSKDGVVQKLSPTFIFYNDSTDEVLAGSCLQK
ncbi:MAG: hypothetical protein JO253_06190 [Alphaproteobacteria bacterium]|nr:hypothetical protein [Alphaproteobacteria bacterium]